MSPLPNNSRPRSAAKGKRKSWNERSSNTTQWSRRCWRPCRAARSSRPFEVYLDGEKVKVGQTDAGQLDLGAFRTSVNEDDLVRWLDREVRQPDIGQAHLRAFLKAVVIQLVNEQHIPVASLAR